MNKGTKIALSVGAVFMLLLISAIGVCLVSYIGAVNSGNRMEQQIKAEHENNKNILANYGQKIAEAAQVPEMMRDDLKAVVNDAITARYGKDGSKAVFQMLREQNPQLDPALYRKLQQLIEAGRDEFKNSQTRLIDVKRSYETELGYFWGGMWLRIAGYPKINLADYKVVTTDATEEAFKTGRDKPMQLRQK